MNKIHLDEKKENIIIEIPLWQDSEDCVGNKIGRISNVVGIICGDEQGLAQVIDLGYKESFDYGDFIYKTFYSRDDFIKLCKELNIDFFEYPVCAYCHEPIFGAFTCSDKGEQCFVCEEKEKKVIEGAEKVKKRIWQCIKKIKRRG